MGCGGKSWVAEGSHGLRREVMGCGGMSHLGKDIREFQVEGQRKKRWMKINVLWLA